MKAKLVKKKEVAKDTLKAVFKLEKKTDFKAGQYAFLRLTDKNIDDPRGNQRHFSIVNPPEENDNIVFTTRLTGSGFKNALKRLKKREVVEIESVAGTFTLDKSDKPLVFIAGGIGITPFISMIKHIQNKGAEREITLVYSNHDKDSTAYFNRLKKLNGEMDNLDVVFTMTSSSDWEGETRRVNKEFILDYFTNLNDYKYMIAGPPSMTEAVYDELLEAGVNKGNIKKENFAGYE